MSNILIDNNGPLEALLAEVDRFAAKVLQRELL